jgi:hypothetical protein
LQPPLSTQFDWGMKTREIRRQKDKIDNLFKKTQIATSGDLEIQSHWAKYMCVLVAGFVENSLNYVYTRYCTDCTNSKVSNFARKNLSKIQNPKSGRFLEVAGSFDQVWRQDLEAHIDVDGRKEAINAIMTNRHLIAHGKNSDITITQLSGYFLKTISVIEFIENQCGLSQE